jgi:GNAT superfamily N-acetyltransferase
LAVSDSCRPTVSPWPPDALDATKIMVELFAELAPVLVAQGAHRFTIDHVDHEGLATALFDLGFGRGGVFAVRGAEPIDLESEIEVRVGTAADLDSITALSHVEFLHRSVAPMYALEQSRPLAETRSAHERLLQQGAIHFLGRRAGTDVGLLTIEHTSPSPRLCPADAPYIGPTATVADARRSGVGRALLQAALRWASERDHDVISVDFDSRNPQSRPFWLGSGFRPTGYRLRRVIANHRVIDADTSHPANEPSQDG